MIRVGLACQILGALHSGVEAAVVSFVRELAARPETELRIFVTKKGLEEIGEIPSRHRIELLKFDPEDRARRVFWECLELPLLLRKRPLDILHGPAYLLPPSCPIHCVATIYDVIALEKPEWVLPRNRWYYRFAMPWTAKSASALIASSRATADMIRKKLPVGSPKIRVLYPGMDGVFDRPLSGADIETVLQKYGLRNPYLLFLGRLEEKKDPETLVKAHLQLLDKGLETDLVLAGSDNPDWAIQSGAARTHRARYPGRLLNLGRIEDRDRPALLSGAKCLVFPSRIEGFGLPPLEAMRVGTPAVVSDLPVLREVLGDGALFAKPGDPLDFARAIRTILTDYDLRGRLIRKGAEISKGYSWPAHVDQVLRLYREILDEG